MVRSGALKMLFYQCYKDCIFQVLNYFCVILDVFTSAM